MSIEDGKDTKYRSLTKFTKDNKEHETLVDDKTEPESCYYPTHESTLIQKHARKKLRPGTTINGQNTNPPSKNHHHHPAILRASPKMIIKMKIRMIRNIHYPQFLMKRILAPWKRLKA